MRPEKQDDWNRRNVDFVKIHGSDDEAFAYLFEELKLAPRMKIGDIMGGYGGVSKYILKQAQALRISLDILLSDAYKSPIAKSRTFLKPYETHQLRVTRIIEDARNSSIASNSLDAVIIKLGLHEFPKAHQPQALAESHRTLKPACAIYIIESVTKTSEMNYPYRAIIRKKDELAGYTQMAQNRYFSSRDEIIEALRSSGFKEIKQIYSGIFKLNTKTFCDADMGGDPDKLQEFNEYLRSFPEDVKLALNFEDRGNDIEFSVEKVIIKAVKKSEIR